MREMALRMLVGVVLFVGCFQPTVSNGGFLCDPADDPPCPTGFYCVAGRCLDSPTGIATAGDDLAGGVGGGGNDRDLGVSQDFAMPPGDLAQSLPDLAQRPPDLAQPRDLASGPDLATGMCGHAGAPCTSINDCCSLYCRTDGICIGG
jgi:hypothetical protein